MVKCGGGLHFFIAVLFKMVFIYYCFDLSLAVVGIIRQVNLCGSSRCSRIIYNNHMKETPLTSHSYANMVAGLYNHKVISKRH